LIVPAAALVGLIIASSVVRKLLRSIGEVWGAWSA
jgi:hypothetical protein